MQIKFSRLHFFENIVASLCECVCVRECVVNNELARQTAKCNATCDARCAALLAATREIKRDNVAYAQRQIYVCAPRAASH